MIKSIQTIRHLAVPFIILLALWACGFSLSVLIERGGQAFVILRQMIPPDYSYIRKIIQPLILTIKMSLCGSVIGSLFAFPTGVLASVKINGCPKVCIMIRGIVNLIRAIPVLVIALASSYILGTGARAGIAAIAIFTYGIVSRMTWEKLDQIDASAYTALLSLGNGSLSAFIHGIMPSYTGLYLSDSLYAMEINIRHAAILGYVGAGGIGLLLNEKIAWREYSKTGMILLMLYIVVVGVEQTGEWIRYRLTAAKEIAQRKKWIYGFIVLSIFLWSITGLNYQNAPDKGIEILKNIVNGLFHPDYSLLFNTTKQGVPWLLLETFCIALGGTAIGAVIALPLALLGSYQTSKKWIAIPVRFTASAVRTVPSIIVGLIMIRVVGPGAFAGVMTMAFLSLGMCTRLFVHTLDQMDSDLIATFESYGCNWITIMRHVVWPQCKNGLYTDCLYRLDVNLRDASVLGFVGAGGIGAPLIFAMNGYVWNMVGAYLLGLIFLIIFVDFVLKEIQSNKINC